jgi:hypothetical protein
MIFYSTVEDLIQARDNLKAKIEMSSDYFLLYGWIRQLEEIEKALEENGIPERH